LRAQLKELDALKAEAAKRDREKLSETERLAAEKADLETKYAAAQAALRETRIEQAIERAVISQGARKPSIVARIIDRSQLEFDERQETPTNVERLVKKLADEEPWLFGKVEAAAAVPGTPRSNSTGKTEADRQREVEDEMRSSGRYARLG
jgi:hypothetical protein